jgi:hypothetical protein
MTTAPDGEWCSAPTNIEGVACGRYATELVDFINEAKHIPSQWFCKQDAESYVEQGFGEIVASRA